MPAKRDDSISYGEKLIRLFAMLLFRDEIYSLTRLAGLLHCTKQTVIRLIDDIRSAYGVEFKEEKKGNQKYYCIAKPAKSAKEISLTVPELTALQMCKTFTEHLLGNQFFHEATRALEKSLPLTKCSDDLPSRKLALPSSHFASFSTGAIDYTPHQETIRILIEAMNAMKICRITYQAVMQKEPKSYHISPLKIFSYRDAMYLHARMAKEPGKIYREPDFDPLLAIHRFKKVELTDCNFEYPADYSFEDVFNKNFGFIKYENFKAEVDFTGWVAHYVAERTWSPDQKITAIGEDKIRLSFSASSRVEVIAWILSFGEHAQVMEPDWLVEDVIKKIKRTSALYKKKKVPASVDYKGRAPLSMEKSETAHQSMVITQAQKS